MLLMLMSFWVCMDMSITKICVSHHMTIAWLLAT